MGLQSFTVQEALNFDSYSEWNYEELDLGTALGGYDTSTYITPENPAKKVVIYPIPGQTVAANDNLYLYLNDTITASGSLAAEAIDGSETLIDVDDAAHFSVGDVILLDAELMYVGGTTEATSPEKITVVRGYGSSAAATHADDTIIYKVGTPSNHTGGAGSTFASVNPIMKIGVDQLPFTFSGVNITRLNMWNTGAENNANDDVSILSFH